MANTRQIRRRISASQNISKITKAMEMVAASKMKRAQDQATAARPYSRALQASLQKVSERTDASLHPLLQTRESGTDIAVLVSTDKGLCGSLNTILFKAVWQWVKEHPNGKIISIGRKGAAFCRVADLPLHAQFTDLPERVSINDIQPLTSLIMSEFLSGNFRSVQIFYMDFINTLSQKMRTINLLPLKAEESYETETLVTTQVASEYTFEPSAREILDELLPYYVENAVFQSLLENRASEHSARMVAMKNASENAAELVDELRLLYNKSRQAAITGELLDIVTASMTVS